MRPSTGCIKSLTLLHLFVSMLLLELLLPYIQIILAVLLVTVVLLQQNEAGLGAGFGGGDSFSSTKYTRRGFERYLFNATIVIAILFTVTSLLALVL